jgi:hypothetical protein
VCVCVCVCVLTRARTTTCDAVFVQGPILDADRVISNADDQHKASVVSFVPSKRLSC